MFRHEKFATKPSEGHDGGARYCNRPFDCASLGFVFRPKLLERFNRRKRQVTRKWNLDETYVKVKGKLSRIIAASDDGYDPCSASGPKLQPASRLLASTRPHDAKAARHLRLSDATFTQTTVHSAHSIIKSGVKTRSVLCEFLQQNPFDYIHATKAYLKEWGKPLAFYSDKHGVFRTTHASERDRTTGLTQFGRALYELNIDIICANTPQAKGRVERANRTLQDRLVKELRLRGIDTIEAANAYAPEPTIGNVFSDRACEQEHILLHNADIGAQRFKLDRSAEFDK